MALKTTPEVSGMGHAMKRKEDPRFIRGQGRYVDDVVLPGMVYLDIVRSPYAHARIKAIHTEKALKGGWFIIRVGMDKTTTLIPGK